MIRLVIAAVGCLATPCLASPQGSSTAADCFGALARGGGARLTCQHRAWLSDAERAELQRLTRSTVLDAKCVVAVDIDRAIVDAALAASDAPFKSPPQPVSCEVETSRGMIPITATFAPEVTFKDGFAVAASPGLANVQGVNGYIAWPVVTWVNSTALIRDEMVRMINAYRARTSARQAAR